MIELKPQFETTENRLCVRAPAKINLSLLIAGKRPDGFHEIETVMAKVNFYDELFIESGQSPGIELICQGPHWAPEGPDNLVVRAATALITHTGCHPNLRLTLIKNIPAGTGLGSASSDAAATLLGLNRYLGLQVPLATLDSLAAKLGSDVPFFLHGPLSYCTGRGEIVSELKASFNFCAVLILPDITISTAKVYKNYLHDHASYERHHQEISAAISKNKIDLLTKICTNMLSKSCYNIEIDLASLRNRIEATGVGPVSLSGSGSALFCILRNGVNRASQSKRTIDFAANCLTRVVVSNSW